MILLDNNINITLNMILILINTIKCFNIVFLLIYELLIYNLKLFNIFSLFIEILI